MYKVSFLVNSEVFTKKTSRVRRTQQSDSYFFLTLTSAAKEATENVKFKIEYFTCLQTISRYAERTIICFLTRQRNQTHFQDMR